MIQQLWQQKTPDKLENEGLFHIPNENDQEFYARMEKLSAELSAIQDGSSDLMRERPFQINSATQQII